jgi:hypothetical protein
MKTDIHAQIKEAQRELSLRKYKYPQWVTSGKMEELKAKTQIALQEAIVLTLIDYEKRTRTVEQQHLPLFGG